MAAVACIAVGASAPVAAHGGGAAVAGLFGGMILGSALRGNRDAEREQAYQSGYVQGTYAAPPPQTVVVQPPPTAGGGGQSVEQRLAELNDLRQKGLISDADFASRKKAILDSL